MNHITDIIRFPIDTLRADGSVDICHNLRPALGDTALTPVGDPLRLTATTIPGAVLLPNGAVTRPGGSQTVFMADREGLLCIDRSGDNTVVYRPEGSAGVTPRCVLQLGGSLLVMTGEGEAPLKLSRDAGDETGRWVCSSSAELPPPLSIVRHDEGLLSATIDPCTLRGSYSTRSTQLTAADEATMRRAMTDAYLAVGDAATCRRVFFQPVVARYRLRSADGGVIYTSAPVLIGPDSGVQLTSATFTLTGSGFNEVSGATLTARAFSLRLTGKLTDSWATRVSSVELLVSPQLHPLEDSLHASCILGSFTATSGRLTVSLPGVNTVAAAPASPSTLLATRVAAMLGRLDSALETAGSARFDTGTGGWNGLESPWYADRRDCQTDIRALRSVMAAPLCRVTPEAEAIRALSAPHVLNATTAGVSGDTVALAGLSVRRFGGHLPAEMAVGIDPEAGQAVPMAVKVTFADGSSSVSSAVSETGAVSLLSPLLTYPSADAVAMQLICATSVFTVSLQPDPSGTMAYWLHPSGAPVAMTQALPAFILPDAAPAPRRFPGMVAVAALESPLSPLALVGSAGADPVAIMAAPGSSGGWDAGSSRFCLFGNSGVQALTVSSSRSRLTVRSLDSRPVSSHSAVCSAGTDIMAIAGGDLVRLSAQKVTTVLPAAGASHIGYSGLNDELWLFPADAGEAVTIITPDGRRRFTRSAPAATSVLSLRPGLWLTDPEGHVHDLTGEQDSDTRIAYRASAVTVHDYRPASRRLFELPLWGEMCAGSVELRGSNGCGRQCSDLLVACELSGHIAHLPPLAVYTPHRHRFILSLSFTARPGDFRLVNYNQSNQPN